MKLDPVITLFKISIKCLDMENENIKQDTWMGKDLNYEQRQWIKHGK